MPFFQGAKDFEIRGGNFYDVNGDQHNHRHDHSFNVSGTGNTATLAPNLSRQDNRTYTDPPAMTKHAGSPQNNQNNPFPGGPEDYQKFLAWQQQGSPMPPNFQQQTSDGPNSPEFTYPQANSFPGYQAQYPSPTDRSYSQPLPSSFDVLSEQSEIHSEHDDATFPGMGAFSNLEECFRRQVRVSGDTWSPPAPSPNSYIPTTNQAMSPISSPSQHQETTLPTQARSSSISPPNSSQQAPLNIAMKPRPRRHSTILAPATASPSEDTLAPLPVMPNTQLQSHRASSSSSGSSSDSSSSSSSDSSHDDEEPVSIQVSSTNNPQPTMSTPSVPIYRPSLMPTPSVPIYGPSLTPPIILVADASLPLSSPPNIGTSPSSYAIPTASPPSALYPRPPLPTPSAASPPIFPGADDPADIFSQLTPLTNAIPSSISGPSESPKKKGFLAKIKLGRKVKVKP